jgi:probable phosphoglycerate mutase
MAAHPRLWLVRHGETAWTLSGQHTGRTDIPLTPTGRRQAGGLARRLASQSFALVLSSPLGRARETCRLAGFEARAELTDDLREWDYGTYEGRTSEAIRAVTPGWSIWTSPIPGGESLEQVGARARRVLDRALGATGDVALFSHGHLLRILAACWIGRPPADGRLLALGTASTSVLGWEREIRVLEHWNLSPE